MALKIAAMVTLFYPQKENFKNIENYLSEVDRLYVIDNTPNKNNQKELPNHKKIVYYNFDNIGVAKALNLAANLALSEKYKWLLTLDQDTEITKKIVKKLKETASKEKTSKIGIITPWHKTKLKIEKPKEKVDYPQDVMTSGNLLNLEIWSSLNGFQEDFFIDGIDIEYGLRLKKNHYKIMRLNDLEINHDLGDIFYVGNKLCTNHNGLRRYYMNRNYHYIYENYKNTDYQFCKFLISNYKTMLKVILFEKHKFSKIYGFCLGYIHFKKGVKGKLTHFLGKTV
ncbi:MAG: glycosyltransferase [Bacilli bacterium]|nr:glycosyltransferase [Bacilli bacterium]